MSADSEFLPPPNEPGAFESLCCDLWKNILKNPGVQKNGRKFQPQAGVDVYGRSSDGWIGIQCKQKSIAGEGALTSRELEAEVAKALNFAPPLEKFILATTGPASADIQRRARELTDEHKARGLFDVEVWDWKSIWSEIYCRPDLLGKIYGVYWPGLLRAAQADMRTGSTSGFGQNHCRIDISRLPATDYNIRGRDSQLKSMSVAWRRKSCRFVPIIGSGGDGKTALVNRWLEDLSLNKKRPWSGAQSVFAWSFF